MLFLPAAPSTAAPTAKQMSGFSGKCMTRQECIDPTTQLGRLATAGRTELKTAKPQVEGQGDFP